MVVCPVPVQPTSWDDSDRDHNNNHNYRDNNPDNHNNDRNKTQAVPDFNKKLAETPEEFWACPLVETLVAMVAQYWDLVLLELSVLEVQAQVLLQDLPHGASGLVLDQALGVPRAQ